MKKSTPCLLSFLLLFLLTVSSCTASPSGVYGDTTDSTTAETTDSSAETTAEETTAAESDTETTVWAPDINYNWINEPLDTIEYCYYKGDQYGEPWFFLRWKNYAMMSHNVKPNYPFTEECMKNAIKVPLKYEVIHRDLIFRFEFFREYYVNRSFIQMRITIINTSEYDVAIREWDGSMGIFSLDLWNREKDTGVGSGCIINPYDKKYNGKNGAMSDSLGLPIPAGESFVCERVLLTYAESYSEESGYLPPDSIRFDVNAHFESEEYRGYRCDIFVPVECVTGEFSLGLPEEGYVFVEE